MEVKFILPFLFFFLLLSTVSGQAPGTVQKSINLEEGVEMAFPPFSTLQQNRDFVFSFHTYNKTSGLLLNNATVSCLFDLFNDTGTDVLSVAPVMANNLIDWKVNVDGANFSGEGLYGYILQCNTSEIGGFIDVVFEVVPDLSVATEHNTTIILFLLVFAIACFFLIFARQSENHFFGFASAIIFLLLGVYLMVYTFPAIENNLFERGFALVLLGIGMYLVVIVGYEWMKSAEQG